jgi:hypothetical protein
MLPLPEGTCSENANQYTSLIAMLIESYALDAAWSTATMISLALAAEGDASSVFQLFNNAGDQVTVSHLPASNVSLAERKQLTPGHCVSPCELSGTIGTGMDSRNGEAN